MQKIRNFLKLILGLVYFPFLVPIAKKKILDSKDKILDENSIYSWTQDFKVGPNIRGFNINFKSSQIKSEILDLISEIKKNPPNIILEIGTATAGTLFMFTKIASPDAEVISIDLPFGRYGAGYLKYRIPLLHSFAGYKQKIHLLRCDSHKQETIEKLKKILNGRKIDFLFIDGDHSYNGVKNDFENYYKLMKTEGLIAFHDIVSNINDLSFGTHDFWEEIKQKYEYKEFIRPEAKNNGCGIGLIKISSKEQKIK